MLFEVLQNASLASALQVSPAPHSWAKHKHMWLTQVMQEQHSQESHSQRTQACTSSYPHLEIVNFEYRISAFCSPRAGIPSEVPHGAQRQQHSLGGSSAIPHPAEVSKWHLCLPGKTLFSSLILKCSFKPETWEDSLCFFSMMIYFPLFWWYI